MQEGSPVSLSNLDYRLLLEKYDLKIRETEEKARSLKSRRNLVVPVCRLPTEILAGVFALCNALEPEEIHGLRNTARKQPTSIRLKHVCRHWRTVALNSPSVWCSPNFAFPVLAREMLQLSKCAHLSIDAHVSCTPNFRLDVLSEALKHISRTRCLFIEARKADIETTLSAVTEPAPFLRSMQLVCHPPADAIALPENFLGGDAPRLCRLELHRCQIPWNTPFLRNLTSLHIDWSGYRCRRPLTTAQFVDTFQKMSRLVVLELRNCLPLYANSFDTPECVVYFPHLRHLTLASTELQCANILELVSFPSTAIITLLCESSTRDVQPFFSTLSNLFSSTLHGGRFIGSAEILFRSQSIGLKTWSTTNPGNSKPSLLPCLDLQFDWRGAYEAVMAAALGSLPFADVRTIRVCSNKHDLPAQVIVDHFGSLCQLEKITITNCVIGFIEAIGRTAPNDPSVSQHSILTPAFPALHTLELKEISLYSPPPDTRRYINGLCCPRVASEECSWRAETCIPSMLVSFP
ncbi:hypothetical protein AAF712_000445 [Marasmius tenuissimus]|uniref:F-box domain-containing protein n=1 Tax=Marasmius tenuissimus TaxID=585030 RepID=A0ABR3AH30_9AGAR